MSKSELTTNVFPIENLGELSAHYSLFRVRGLDESHQDYFRNRAQLEYGLRRETRSPACVYEQGGELIAAVASEVEMVPPKFSLVRATVRLDSLDEERELDFTAPSICDIPLCLNVLHFHFQEALENNDGLWQPSSGQPVYFKEATRSYRSLNLFRGMAVRPCALPNGGFGIVVDVKHRYVHRDPLPGTINRDSFRRWKGQNVIYHFGEVWYEIRLDLCSGLTIDEVEIPTASGTAESLFDHVLRRCRRPHPREISDLSPDDAALGYLNSGGEARSVPASLCFATATSEHPDARHFEEDVKLSPSKRLRLTENLVRQHLRRTTRNGMCAKVSCTPIAVKRSTYPIPDLLFGNETTLSTRRTNAVYVGLKDWGRRKFELLNDKNVGFMDQEPLGRQYLVLPQSVQDSYGTVYKTGLFKAVDDLFPQKSGYSPREITYDDRTARTVEETGRRIIEAVEAAQVSDGHALVVVKRGTNRKQRSEDELSALVVRELFERGLTVAVSHTDVPDECLVENRSGRNRGLHYVVDNRKRGKWNGYLKGLALNKVLLTNERWPFAFDETLHADLTIGIDVKNNTAGFVLVGPKARIIRMHCATSRRKERISEDQIETELCKLIEAEAPHLERGLASIAIHRDGRLYEEEQRGIRRAMEKLVREGVVPAQPQLTLLEIHKASSMSVRLFDVSTIEGKKKVRNQKVGDHFILGTDAFLATTGWPFERPGTARPLHVKYLEGSIPLEKALQDIFWLSCLTFTRPNDCSTVPIHLRLLDRRLREEAGDYDEDALRYSSSKGRESA